MKTIIAPEVYENSNPNEKFVFLAGGITDCWDWQSYVYDKIRNVLSDDIIVFSPRRTNWDMNAGSDESEKQIMWENHYLIRSDLILFWFPHETLCPIVLFELGAALERNDNIIVGCHPDYKRKFDVEIQTRLVDPSIRVYDDLDELIDRLIIELTK